MGFLWILTEYAGLPYTISSVIAIELSILNNFWWNNAWTWADRRASGARSLAIRVLKYHASVLVSAVANWGLLVLLTESFGVHYMVANAAGIAVGVVLNYTLSDRLVFSPVDPSDVEAAHSE
jgi:dolichol-phosphate mannosyltransferase